MDYYLLLKALHVTSVILWIGSMAGFSFILSRQFQEAGADRSSLQGLRLLNRRLVEPAMGLAWIAGIGLAIWGDWIPDAWLIGKLVFVIILSALHGMLTGRLKRLVKGLQAETPVAVSADSLPLRAFFAMPFLALIVVAIVFTKPF